MFYWLAENFNDCLGIIGAVILLISMSIPSTHRRQNILMRCINIIGSVVLVIYSLRLAEPAIANIFLNSSVCLINLYYIIILMRSMKKDNKKIFSKE